MNEDMVEAIFDWISDHEMRAGNLRFIIEVPNNKPASFRSLVSYKSLV